MNSHLLGRWGEVKAAEWMRKKGYEVVASGYRSRYGEIDLIAMKDGYLAFVEVKLRKNAYFAQAREAVTPRKQHCIRTTAQCYLAEHPTDLQPRFDVVEVYAPQGVETKKPEIRYWENAF